MFKINKQKNQGFIALFPALIISSILIILCVGISQSFLAVLYRTILFDEKVQSDILVQSCESRILAKISQNDLYEGGENIIMSNNPTPIQCDVGVFLGKTVSITVRNGEALSSGIVVR